MSMSTSPVAAKNNASTTTRKRGGGGRKVVLPLMDALQFLMKTLAQVGGTKALTSVMVAIEVFDNRHDDPSCAEDVPERRPSRSPIRATTSNEVILSSSSNRGGQSRRMQQPPLPITTPPPAPTPLDHPHRLRQQSPNQLRQSHSGNDVVVVREQQERKHHSRSIVLTNDASKGVEQGQQQLPNDRKTSPAPATSRERQQHRDQAGGEEPPVSKRRPASPPSLSSPVASQQPLQRHPTSLSSTAASMALSAMWNSVGEGAGGGGQRGAGQQLSQSPPRAQSTTISSPLPPPQGAAHKSPSASPSRRQFRIASGSAKSPILAIANALASRGQTAKPLPNEGNPLPWFSTVRVKRDAYGIATDSPRAAWLESRDSRRRRVAAAASTSAVNHNYVIQQQSSPTTAASAQTLSPMRTSRYHHQHSKPRPTSGSTDLGDDDVVSEESCCSEHSDDRVMRPRRSAGYMSPPRDEPHAGNATSVSRIHGSSDLRYHSPLQRSGDDYGQRASVRRALIPSSTTTSPPHDGYADTFHDDGHVVVRPRIDLKHVSPPRRSLTSPAPATTATVQPQQPRVELAARRELHLQRSEPTTLETARSTIAKQGSTSPSRPQSPQLPDVRDKNSHSSTLQLNNVVVSSPRPPLATSTSINLTSPATTHRPPQQQPPAAIAYHHSSRGATASSPSPYERALDHPLLR